MGWFRDVFWLAVSHTVHETFSTSFPALSVEIAILLYAVWRVLRRVGKSGVKTYLEEIRHGAFIVVVAWTLALLYNALITIPSQIRTEANHAPFPAFPLKLVPNLSPPIFPPKMHLPQPPQVETGSDKRGFLISHHPGHAGHSVRIFTKPHRNRLFPKHGLQSPERGHAPGNRFPPASGHCGRNGHECGGIL